MDLGFSGFSSYLPILREDAFERCAPCLPIYLQKKARKASFCWTPKSLEKKGKCAKRKTRKSQRVAFLFACQSPPKPKTIRVTEKCLKSDFWGSSLKWLLSDKKETQTPKNWGPKKSFNAKNHPRISQEFSEQFRPSMQTIQCKG